MNRPPPLPWFALFVGASSIGLVPVAAGEEFAPAALRAPSAMSFAVQPEELPDGSGLAAAAAPPRFGEQGSQWITVGTGIGYDFSDSTDWNIHGAYSYFLVDDVEVSAELALWYFGNAGDFEVGVNPNVVFRWHFVNTDDWTVFADAGIGVALSSDDVPDGGSSFNFTPRAGVGFTKRLTDSGLRLQGGLRWHHMSNARILGESDNPGRDAPLVYAGIVFPF